jgi:leukotriene-A4 hydrolase
MVGEVGFQEVAPRSRVYPEVVVTVLDEVVRVFAGTEDMIRQGEFVVQSELIIFFFFNN